MDLNIWKRLLNRFEFNGSNLKSTPCHPTFNKCNTADSKAISEGKLYRWIVSSLIYALTCTRPDLCYVVTKLAKPT